MHDQMTHALYSSLEVLSDGGSVSATAGEYFRRLRFATRSGPSYTITDTGLMELARYLNEQPDEDESAYRAGLGV